MYEFQVPQCSLDATILMLSKTHWEAALTFSTQHYIYICKAQCDANNAKHYRNKTAIMQPSHAACLNSGLLQTTRGI